MNTKITGLGSYIPKIRVTNKDFVSATFLDEKGDPLKEENEYIIDKFKSITGIEERRYAEDHLLASDLGFFASEKAIEDAKIDKETIDYIIYAHNFGDVNKGSNQMSAVPSLASKVKEKLKIENSRCVAYDILFGCPGWIEGVIQSHAFIKAGIAKRCLVIGGETLSRIIDENDRDSMIFADGAGATIIEATGDEGGLLSHLSATFTNNNETEILDFNCAYNPQEDTKFIKMKGRKVYEFALLNVPLAMKECFDETKIPIEKLKKIFIHQANEKMDEAIVKRFYKLYKSKVPEGIMPMNIRLNGNSSVATIPTLYNQVLSNELEGHEIHKGDVVLFASVGAGMNINAITYIV